MNKTEMIDQKLFERISRYAHKLVEKSSATIRLSIDGDCIEVIWVDNNGVGGLDAWAIHLYQNGDAHTSGDPKPILMHNIIVEWNQLIRERRDAVNANGSPVTCTHKPLTKERISGIREWVYQQGHFHNGEVEWSEALVRAVEKEHGITGDDK